MDMEYKSGKKAVNIRDIGRITDSMDMAISAIQMEIIMRENGRMMFSMDKANIPVLMAIAMQVGGKQAKNMAMVRKNGRMISHIKDSIMKGIRLEQAC